ncbi:O-antigen ligase family protein [Sporosarcina thermotolerans]|uniref:O-antigen ligase family protein n=1 Tax=Sporosarcina thermotolerans TaxID=633404 RepID=A0AAW9A7H6_9BACL|nr:O-antigen ligase family protein [Sporosarcina thermotolerans]
MNEIRLDKIIDSIIFFYILSIYIFTYQEGLNVISNGIAVLLLALIWAAFLLNKKRLRFKFYLLVYLLFIFSCLFSAFYAINQGTAITKFTTIFLVFTLMFSLINYLDSQVKIKRISASFVYSGVIASIYILSNTDFTQITRSGSELGNENSVGIILGISAVLCFYFILIEKRKVHLFFFPILFLVILLTGSRTALLFTLINIILFLYFTNQNNVLGKIKFITIGVTFTLISFYLVFNIPFLYDVMGSRIGNISTFIGEGSTTEGSINNRAYMVKFGLEMFRDNPLFGYGIDNYRYLLGESLIGRITYSHNNFIELLVGVGLVGTILFYLVQIIVIKDLYKASKHSNNKPLNFVFMVFIITYMVLSVSQIYYFSKHFSIILVIGAILGKMVDNLDFKKG